MSIFIVIKAMQLARTKGLMQAAGHQLKSSSCEPKTHGLLESVHCNATRDTELMQAVSPSMATGVSTYVLVVELQDQCATSQKFISRAFRGFTALPSLKLIANSWNLWLQAPS